jgi:hypothetical protein
MRIIPKIIGEVQTYYIKEAENVVNQSSLEIVNTKSDPQGRTPEQQLDAAKKNADKVNSTTGSESLKIAVNSDPKDPRSVINNEGRITEYRNPNATRYNTWVDVFVNGVRDKEWRNSVYLQKDIFHLAESVPFTDSDLSVIEDFYSTPDAVDQQITGTLGVILKNALARRSPLPEDMKVKLRAFDSRLSAMARNNGINKKKNLERTMDVSLKAHYLKLQGRDSWAEARGNIMGLPENQNVIGVLLRKEIDRLLAGGTDNNLGLKKELNMLISKQSDTRVKIRNRGEQHDPKDYIPVNLLLLYAVLTKDINLVRTAIEAEGQEIDPHEQSRIKGRFTPKLETILSGLVEHEEMSDIKNVLINAHLIPKPKKIIPKFENRTMGKTIIITERQAKMLSLLRFNENTASNATKGGSFDYETPENGGYTKQSADGTDYAKQLEKKRHQNKDAARKATAGEYKPAKNLKKSLSVDKGKEIEAKEKRLNDYFVKEGVEYYQVVTKDDLMNKLFK